MWPYLGLWIFFIMLHQYKAFKTLKWKQLFCDIITLALWWQIEIVKHFFFLNSYSKLSLWCLEPAWKRTIKITKKKTKNILIGCHYQEYPQNNLFWPHNWIMGSGVTILSSWNQMKSHDFQNYQHLKYKVFFTFCSFSCSIFFFFFTYKTTVKSDWTHIFFSKLNRE